MPVKRNPAARRNKLKAETQDDFRNKLSLGKTVAAITRIENRLEKINDTQALVAMLNSKWKRMNKLMPDLKQVDADIKLSGEVDHNIEVVFRGSRSS